MEYRVIEGDLRIDFRNGAVHIGTGEMFVVPKGVEHKPYAANEVKLLLIEPRGEQRSRMSGSESQPTARLSPRRMSPE